jgi:hypothetical protein
MILSITILFTVISEGTMEGTTEDIMEDTMDTVLITLTITPDTILRGMVDGGDMVQAIKITTARSLMAEESARAHTQQITTAELCPPLHRPEETDMYQEDQALVQPEGPHPFPMFQGPGELFLPHQVKDQLMLPISNQTRVQ